MPTRHAAKTPEEQLLGEIETRIAGMQYYDAAVGPGEQVNLEREPDNRHDPCSIRVEIGRFQPVGHLPRQIVAWLAPLVDPGKPYQCPGCGALLDATCIQWCEQEGSCACVCPDCGTVSRQA